MPKGILTSGWLPIAQLLRPQGRRGELLADPLSDLPGLFAAGSEAVLAMPGASSPTSGYVSVAIQEHFYPTGKNAGRIVLKLSGCDSISQAEILAGKHLLIPTAALPPLDPGTFFVGDLIGCTLFDTTGPHESTPVGTIVDLEFATAPDGRTRLEDAAPLLAVAPIFPESESGAPNQPADSVLVPFVRAWLDSVDVPGRRITMRLPEGLFDNLE